MKKLKSEGTKKSRRVWSSAENPRNRFRFASHHHHRPTEPSGSPPCAFCANSSTMASQPWQLCTLGITGVGGAREAVGEASAGATGSCLGGSADR